MAVVCFSAESAQILTGDLCRCRVFHVVRGHPDVVL